MRTLLGILCAASMALGLCSCSDEDPVVPPVDTPRSVLPFAATRDQLMGNLESAYETLESDQFADLLHPAHLTILQAGTTARFPDVGESLELSQELRVHRRMFSGDPLIAPDGAPVPGVAGISIEFLQIRTPWSESIDPLFPTVDRDHPVERALYDVMILINRGQTFSTLKVQGQIEFFVTSRDSFHNGATRKFYVLRGQRDLTLDHKAEENTAWGTAKALFR